MIIIGVTVLLLILCVAGIIYYKNRALLAMKPDETQANIQGSDVITIKNAGNNIYLIKAEEGYIMMDAGANSQGVIESLKEMAITPEEVKYVFLTHSDYDHVAALDQLVESEIYIGENEIQYLDGTSIRGSWGGNTLPEGVDLKQLILVTDGEIIAIGGHEIKVVNAPGHTFGSVLYLLDGKCLFSGDAFAVVGNQIMVQPYSMDYKQSQKTIDNLKGLIKESEWLFTGHYGAFQTEVLK